MISLEQFIVDAKRATYVGGGKKTDPCRVGAHDLVYTAGDWHYRDSYFGGTDFLGQEVVWKAEEPLWAMNYYGFIIQPTLIDAEIAGNVVKAVLSQLYSKGRFLGGFHCNVGAYEYHDQAEGDYTHFHGVENIRKSNQLAYELRYSGGLIKA